MGEGGWKSWYWEGSRSSGFHGQARRLGNVAGEGNIAIRPAYLDADSLAVVPAHCCPLPGIPYARHSTRQAPPDGSRSRKWTALPDLPAASSKAMLEEAKQKYKKGCAQLDDLTGDLKQSGGKNRFPYSAFLGHAEKARPSKSSPTKLKIALS